MPFSIQCTNKGCCQMQQPYIDPKTEKVYCSVCDLELPQVTNFAKQQMKMFKQFKEKKKVSFSTKCNKCSGEDRPVKKNNLWLCKSCGSELNLGDSFKSVLELFLKTADKEI